MSIILQQQIIYKYLNLQDYKITLAAMQRFTENRNIDSLDEIWFLEHPKIFTLGKTSSEKHLLAINEIEIVKTDRGGQITYHAPGQLIVYFLINLIRRSLTVKDLIYILQQSIIDLLQNYYNIDAEYYDNAPGVYVFGKKICSIGLKITKGCSYHGLSFNVDMDLAPFKQINPCGDPKLEITQLKDVINSTTPINLNVIAKLLKNLINFKFNQYGII